MIQRESLRFVGFVNGMLIIVLSVSMLLPMLADLLAGHADWLVFAFSAALTAFAGGSLAVSFQGGERRIERQAGYLLTVSAWTMVGAFASLPLVLSKLDLTFTDAIFETMSGLTTTGSTVLVGLDDMPPGILLWRSLLQGIGGVGIVVTAIVLLPALGVGGMQLFRTESSDISGKPTYSVYEMALLTIGVYVGLIVACTVGYSLAGMDAFDAVNHALTTISTGGYSTHDASIGHFDSVAIEVVSIVFMMAGAFPLIWYAVLLTRPRGSIDQERQVPILLAILATAVLLVTAWNTITNDMPVMTALRLSAVNVTSILTDTGYATADYSAWGSFAVGIFFALLFIGGCAGSTSGAIKIFRWQLLAAGVRHHLKLALSPNRVMAIRFGGRRVDDGTIHAVRNFFFMYFMTFLALSLMVMATGLDFLSSTSAVAQAMANAGPGLGPVVGPATNFASISDPAKWILVAGMLLGRLELSTVYVLFLAEYWNWR